MCNANGENISGYITPMCAVITRLVSLSYTFRFDSIRFDSDPVQHVSNLMGRRMEFGRWENLEEN